MNGSSTSVFFPAPDPQTTNDGVAIVGMGAIFPAARTLEAFRTLVESRRKAISMVPPGRWDPPLIRGRLLTVDQMAGAPGAKLALGQKSGAVAVDMEAATLARRCSKEGVPFGCVRVVLDEVQTPLSPRLVQNPAP